MHIIFHTFGYDSTTHPAGVYPSNVLGRQALYVFENVIRKIYARQIKCKVLKIDLEESNIGKTLYP